MALTGTMERKGASLDKPFLKNNVFTLEALFILATVLLIFNNISFDFDLPNATEEIPGLLRPHHVAQIMLGISLYHYKALGYVSRGFLAFFLMGTSFSLAAYSVYGFNQQIVTFVYCYLIAINSSGLLKVVGYGRALYLARVVFFSVVALVLLKNVFYVGEIISAAQSGSRVLIPGLVAGGVNPEATAIALGCFLFIGSRYFTGYFFVSVALCLVYSSRGALLLCGLVILISIILNPTRSRIFILLLTIVSVVSVVYWAPQGSSIQLFIGKISDRFSDFGDDPGSQGRYLLWANVPEMLKVNPFGYGIMNAVPISEVFTGYKQPVIHMHNIFIQCVMDLGIPGLILYLYLVFSIFGGLVRLRDRNLFNAILVGYFFAGLVRFRLYDTFIFVFWGLAISVNKSGLKNMVVKRIKEKRQPLY
jgi:O-antigen ligase